MFEIQLKTHSQHKALICVPRNYDDRDDDVTSILSDVCCCLQESGRVSFIINGFDTKPWPVDVATDFCIFLEQLPDLLKWLTGNETGDCTVSFYEQGVQRDLIFNRHARELHIRCVSWSEWEPASEQEIVREKVFHAMLVDILNGFFHQAEIVCPDLYHHPWLQAWVREISVKRDLTTAS